MRGSIILELHKPHNIVHALDHVDWRECWLSRLQVEIIDVICWDDRLHALHKIPVSNFVNLEKLLVVISENSLHIGTQVFEFERSVVSNAHLACIDLKV